MSALLLRKGHCVIIALLCLVPGAARGFESWLPTFGGASPEGQELHNALGLSALGLLDEHRRQVAVLMDQQRRRILERSQSATTTREIRELYDWMAFTGLPDLTVGQRAEALSRYLRYMEMVKSANEASRNEPGADVAEMLETQTVARVVGYDLGAGRAYGGTVSASVDIWSIDGRESIGASWFLAGSQYGGRNLLRLSLGNERGRVEIAHGIEEFNDSEFGVVVGDGSWVSLQYSTFDLSGNVILGGGRSAFEEFRIGLPLATLLGSPEWYPRLQLYFERVPTQRQRVGFRLNAVDISPLVTVDALIRLQLSDQDGIDMRSGTAYGRAAMVALDGGDWHVRVGSGLSYAGDLTDRSYLGLMAMLEFCLGAVDSSNPLRFGITYSHNYFPTFAVIPDPDVAVIQVRYGAFP